MTNYNDFIPTAMEAKECTNKQYVNCSLLDEVSNIINRDMNNGYYNTYVSVEGYSIRDIDYITEKLTALGYIAWVSLSDLYLNIVWGY